MTISRSTLIDWLDAALIELLAAEPRVGVLEASRRLSVARGTVQARLDRLQDRGVITGYGPGVDPVALGREVTTLPPRTQQASLETARRCVRAC